MYTIEQVRQQGKDLVATGDVHRAILITSTPMRLAVLHLHLANYIDVMNGRPGVDELVEGLKAVQLDVQQVVTQILQQEFPPS